MKRIILPGIFIIFLAQTLSADIPQIMSYQGLLTNAIGTPVPDGNYSLTFRLYDVPAGGGALWTETHSSVAVVKGIFNVILGGATPPTPLTLPFDRQYWLGVTVGAGPELSPRIKLTSSAYSLNARSVADGAITTAKLADNAVTAAKIQPNIVSSVGGVSNDGGSIDLVPGANITITPDDAVNKITISAFDVWKLNGNAGTTPGTHFLGTTDDKALELRGNNTRILRLEPNTTSPNILGGFNGNSITSGVYGATISGGGKSGFINRVTDNYSTVGGGYNNQAGDNAGTADDKAHATVGGGYGNKATGLNSTIAGGWLNEASGRESVVGGGLSNHADGTNATVSGGNSGEATGDFSTVGGGYGNSAIANYATIAGGGRSVSSDIVTGNRVTDNYGTVGGGGNNQAGDNAGTTDDAYYATVGGGKSNEASDQYATVSGGWSNDATEVYTTVGGGYSNDASANSATISGGYNSSASGDCATIGGGYRNDASSDSVTIGGGRNNTASGSYATIGGGYGNQAIADYATIGGGGRSDPGSSSTGNRVKDSYGTISGGGDNQAGDDETAYNNASYATVGGGKSNKAIEKGSTVSGGIGNIASGLYSVVAGGVSNDATGNYSFVGGGDSNQATKLDTTVGGGYGNEATGEYSTISGGWINEASGQYATIPGGAYNGAQGNYSFAAGRHAKANGNGCFVWGDYSTSTDITASGDNQFKARTSGGVWFYSTSDLTKGVRLEAGGTGWVGFNTSDKALKYNIRSVNGKDILYRLAQIPISRWSYQSEGPKIEHVGPMAQDFYAAFGAGEDDRHISTVDAEGIALAAIQGLYELVKEKDAKIATQREQIAIQQNQIAALEARLIALEARMK